SFGTGFFNQIYATWGIVVPQAASPHLYVQTMAVPAIGTMHFDTRWLLHDSSTDYDIFFNQDHGVSGPLAYTIDRTKLATVSYAINAQKPGLHMSFGLFPGYINGRYSWWLPKDVVPPLTKTMVVSPGPDSYQPLLRMIPSADPVWGGQADLRAPLEQFTAGQVANIPLLVGPGRPSADQLGVITGAVGADCVPIYGTVARIPATDDVTCKVIPGSDILVFTPTEFVDAMGNSALLYSPQALTNITIAQNGQQLAQGDNANGLGVQVPPEAAAYKIAMDTDLSAEPWVVEGIRTHTAWGFSSSPADTNKTIPLLTVDYIAPINMLNQLQSAGGTSYMRIKVGHSPTTGTPPGINPPTVKISTDDGATWTQVYASPRSGGEYRMDLDNLPSTGFLSVSVSMTDTSGATFDQQIIRAYALHQ
ncbi:MAG TPA: hypothetical protein VG015_08300, partial [Candidatus Dormibacteraeota bacterium]|nr:hypothetical protein [Candidatus Dormibacteraeota bacterium]